ncbi:MAG: DNA-directed RNA polymerase subunit beta [Lentisphaeria bacterium]|nr:DNA-directed RNA polymerase subunit beta [Lentisphaeria bacterium]
MQERINFGSLKEVLAPPNLIDVQIGAYRDFLQKGVELEDRQEMGIQEAFNEVFPIESFDKMYKLNYIDYSIGDPRNSRTSREDIVVRCLKDGLTYCAPLYVTFQLENKNSAPVEEKVFMGDIPLMTQKGSFIINGAERVIVSQLHRTPGICFEKSRHSSGRTLFSYRVIPDRGSWLEVQFDINDLIYIYLDRRRRRRKFLVTTFLRAIGYSSNKDILEATYGCETKTVAALLKDEGLNKKYTAEAIMGDDEQVIVDELTPLTVEILDELKALKVKKVCVVDTTDLGLYIINCIQKETVRNTDDALKEVYKRMRPGDPANVKSAKQLLHRLFFDVTRYDLGLVGRYKINQKLGGTVDPQERTLLKEDLVAATCYLSKLKLGKGKIDDIDHLGNRRVRTIGELIQNQARIGLVRTDRLIRERMTLLDMDENTVPSKLINLKAFSGVIRDFFGRNQLSQFMDQTNPLSELTNKRRLSALGPGGLSRERAGFEVRDVHPSHYGRVCPIETPEGPNIGLISSLALYARINDLGFIETPYRKVIEGKVTDEIEYLVGDQEEQFVIAQANSQLNKDGSFINDYVLARHQAESVQLPRLSITHIDVSPKQLVSAAAGIIPFLEHDDANRALMGSNMQRQAVPLLIVDSPLVGTGLEKTVARDSQAVQIAREDGIVFCADSSYMVTTVDGLSPELTEDPTSVQEYKLHKFLRSNSSTCINQTPLVRTGDKVCKGDTIADGSATQNGELALGKNVLVAFMTWCGYNFEDAIIISERMVKDDVYTSVHISEYDIQARDTKLGAEEITRDIPNVSEEVLRNLDPEGIVRKGAEVMNGDILVGKITPKSETELAPEERLLRAIFGEKAADVKDSSLYAGGTGGIVMEVRVERKYDPAKGRMSKAQITRRVKDARIDDKSQYSDLVAELADKLSTVLLGSKLTVDIVNTALDGEPAIIPAGRKITKNVLRRLAMNHRSYKIQKNPAKKRIDEVMKQFNMRFDNLETRTEEIIDRLENGNGEDQGVVKSVKVYVASKRKIQVGDKMAGRHGNKGIVSRVVPVEDMPYMEDGTPVDIILNPLGVPSRMNVGQILETHLGWAAQVLGMKVATPVFDGASEDKIFALLKEAGLPEDGKSVLYDGRTGEAFDQRITTGFIYMLKLDHLVVNKIHARAVGPYSLVTQQPLGGKAQHGGQRFGEMEVWALEAFGAAHTLQEMLTVKSDDVIGRTKIYESIVKGDYTLEPGIPESFNVLTKEMQALCLDVRLKKRSSN